MNPELPNCEVCHRERLLRLLVWEVAEQKKLNWPEGAVRIPGRVSCRILHTQEIVLYYYGDRHWEAGDPRDRTGMTGTKIYCERCAVQRILELGDTPITEIIHRADRLLGDGKRTDAFRNLLKAWRELRHVFPRSTLNSLSEVTLDLGSKLLCDSLAPIRRVRDSLHDICEASRRLAAAGDPKRYRELESAARKADKVTDDLLQYCLGALTKKHPNWSNQRKLREIALATLPLGRFRKGKTDKATPQVDRLTETLKTRLKRLARQKRLK